LTHILSPTLLTDNTRINVISSVYPGQAQLRHSVTALKFVTKIRDVLHKKLLRESRGSSTSSNLGPFIKDMENIVQENS
jgi:hypothetical protein